MLRGVFLFAVAVSPFGSAAAQDSDLFRSSASPQLKLTLGVEIQSSVNGTTTLAEPRQILASSSGIYILDPLMPGVTRFDRQGEWIGTIGEKGEGPGEFRSPDSMGWLSDTLWVVDRDLGRLSLFDRDMVHVNSVSFRIVTGTTLAMPRAAVGPWVLSLPYISANAKAREDSVPLLAFDRGGNVRDTLAWIAGGRSTVSVTITRQGEDRQVVSVRNPFDTRGLMAHDPQSRWVYIGTWGTDSNDKSYLKLVKLAADGDTVNAAELPIERVPATGGDVRAHARRLRDEAPELLRQRLSVSTLTRAFLSQVPDPSISGVDAMLASEEGTIWLRRTMWIDEAASERWLAFRWHEGLVGHVVLPMGESMLATTGGMLWSISHDALGLPSIKGWSVTSYPGN